MTDTDTAKARPVDVAAQLAVILGKVLHGKPVGDRLVIHPLLGPRDENGLIETIKIKDVFWTSGGMNVYLENGQVFAFAAVNGKLADE